MKKFQKNMLRQTGQSQSYANRDALFDSEKGLPKYNASIVKSFHDFFVSPSDCLEFIKPQTTLDFGAGTGQLADIFKSRYGITPICVEIDPELFQVLLGKRFECLQSLKNLEFPVSMIYSSNVLEHIEDDSSALNEMFAKLQKNGKLAIYVPAFMFLFSDLDVKAGHFRRYSKKELISKVSDAGFTVESCFYNDSLGVLASLVLKLFGYRNKINLGSGNSLVFYDRVIYPISQFLDKIGMNSIIGKNLYIFAIKK